MCITHKIHFLGIVLFRMPYIILRVTFTFRCMCEVGWYSPRCSDHLWPPHAPNRNWLLGRRLYTMPLRETTRDDLISFVQKCVSWRIIFLTLSSSWIYMRPFGIPCTPRRPQLLLKRLKNTAEMTEAFLFINPIYLHNSQICSTYRLWLYLDKGHHLKC